MVRKPSKSFLVIILAVANLFLFGCNDKPLFIELHSASSESENTSSWDFSEATDYIYDPEKIEFVGGKAQLKEVDQTHEGSDFNSGTHVGTYYDSSNSKLSLLKRPVAIATHVNTIIPARSPNLTNYWRMDGSLDNEVAIGMTGMPIGGAVNSSSSKVGSGSLLLPAINDYLDLGNGSEAELSPEFTISAWVYHDPTVNFYPSILCRTSAFDESVAKFCFYFLNNTGRPSLAMGGSIRNSNLVVSPKQWTFVAVTYDGSNTIFYVNGIKEVMGALGAPTYGLETAKIGAWAGGSANGQWQGAIDEIAIWDDNLTETEIDKLYVAQNASFSELSPSWTPHYDNLIAYWKLDGNWQDSSENEYHGTPVNAPTFSTAARVGSQAASFDGTNQRLQIPAFDIGSTSILTGMAWVKHQDADTGAVKGILYKDSPLFDFFINGRRLTLYLTNGTAYHLSVQSAEFFDWDQWHHVAFTYDGSNTRLYRDGQLVATSGAESGDVPSSNAIMSIGFQSSGNYFDGLIDEVALIKNTLSASEISQIYNRQKQKYASHYDSPVIDLGTSGSWTSLTAATALPFGKEIVVGTSESSSDYSALSGDLRNGLVGYWPLNENFDDLLGVNHASNNGSNIEYTSSPLGTASARFRRTGQYIDLPFGAGIDPSVNPLSISFWATKLDSIVAQRIYFSSGQTGNDRLYIGISSSTWSIGVQSTTWDVINSPEPIEVGRWYHITLVMNGTSALFYLDSNYIGKIDYGSFTLAQNFAVGRHPTTPVSYDVEGAVDELGIWSRALTPNEIQQLYRRGANRVKYQVKSCIDSSCECKSFNTAPVGNSSDCDGDGILNSADNDDTHKAEFVGPGGNGVTAFSELFNRDSGNMAFTCNANTTDSDNDICVDDEITLSGDSKASSPSFSFFDFPSSSRPLDNRYFQYRVLMEAEENTACGGEPCLPELTSIEIGPTGRYYSGSPSVVNKTGQSLDEALESLKVTNSSGCNMSYQISNDGNNFYYWDGTSWVTGSDVSESNGLAILNGNISSFTDQVGLGDFYFKSFLGNSSFSECELDKIEVNKARR